MSTRVAPLLIIALLSVVFFSDLVVHPSEVLYSDHSDFLAMHLPLKRFLVRSWQETGEIPLWNPYSFAGMPFVHDVQVAAFYPLHWPLYLLPEEQIGPAMSWLVVLHVFLAGLCMYGYAASRGLGRQGSLVAGTGYMFAGKWLFHILAGGHYIMAPLAWLPLVLFFFERALRQRSLLSATWAGPIFALIVLGTHPQMTLYAGVFVALWGLGSGFDPQMLSERGVFAFLLRWLLMGTWTLVTAIVLSAVQLLPALEAAGESSRAAGVGLREIFLAAGPSLLGLIGPGLTTTWEDRGGLAVLWLAAAIAAPLLCPGRSRYEGFVSIALVIFALGGAALVQWLPGFRLFQLPVRMLMLLALPISFLAGRTTELLFSKTHDLCLTRHVCRSVLGRVFLVSLFLVIVAAGVSYRSSGASTVTEWLDQIHLRSQVYWPVLMCTAPAALWLLRERCPANVRAWQAAWFVVLLADALALTESLVAVRPQSEIYAPSHCVRDLIERRQNQPSDRWRVLDRALPKCPSSAPLGAALPMFGGIELEPVLGYNSFDVRRYKEYLQFIHGEDKPVVPREGIFGYPIINNFAIKNKALLDLLDVRFLLQPHLDLQLSGEGEPARDKSWRLTGKHDPNPRVYSFLAGGVQDLVPYSIYENEKVFPRAFKVHRAIPLAERADVYAQLISTDFRREVLLANWHPPPDEGPSAPRSYVAAEIREYQPNRVVVVTHGEEPGFVVLADLWFPGWTCLVDGQAAQLYRANYLFRGVAVPGGRHEVTFLFAPASYFWGQAISLTAGAAVVFFTLLATLSRALFDNSADRLVSNAAGLPTDTEGSRRSKYWR